MTDEARGTHNAAKLNAHGAPAYFSDTKSRIVIYGGASFEFGRVGTEAAYAGRGARSTVFSVQSLCPGVHK